MWEDGHHHRPDDRPHFLDSVESVPSSSSLSSNFSNASTMSAVFALAAASARPRPVGTLSQLRLLEQLRAGESVSLTCFQFGVFPLLRIQWTALPACLMGALSVGITSIATIK